MKAYITRDSVHMGDDVNAPHTRRFDVSDEWSWAELVGQVWRASQLPGIPRYRRRGDPIPLVLLEAGRPWAGFGTIADPAAQSRGIDGLIRGIQRAA